MADLFNLLVRGAQNRKNRKEVDELSIDFYMAEKERIKTIVREQSPKIENLQSRVTSVGSGAGSIQNLVGSFRGGGADEGGRTRSSLASGQLKKFS